MNSTYALVVFMLVAGFVAARSRAFPDNAADTLNRFVIYVCLPARILQLVPDLHYSPGLLLIALTPWLTLPLAYVTVVAASRLFRWPRPVRGALLLCVPLGNTSFLGFPMIEAIVGPKAVGLAVVFDQFGSFLILTTYGLLVLALYGGSERPTPREIAVRVARFPPFIALALALIPIQTPTWIDWFAAPLAATLVPLAMFAIGMKMQLRPPERWSALAFGLVTKMAILPAVALAIATIARASGSVTRVVVLESAMPPMVTAGALAMMARLAPELAAALVGYGIVVSLGTLPWIDAMVR